MKYAFTGDPADFADPRLALESAGVVITETSTDDNVLHVYTETAIPDDLMPSYTLVEA